MDTVTLRNRFHEEQEYLQKYVEFLQFKTAVSRTDIGELSNVLSKYNLMELKYETGWASWKDPFQLSGLENIYSQLHSAKERIESNLAEVKVDLNITKAPQDLKSTDMRSYEGELIQFMLEGLEGDLSANNIETVRREAIRLSNEIAQTGNTEVPGEDVIDFAIQSAVYILKSRKYYELAFVCEKFNEIEIAVRMQRPEAAINVLRQGFILLMTIFDATVFDLMRVALRKDFFRLIGVVGKKDKISLESLNRYDSFDKFRDEIIEEQLKPKYIKDILSILENQNVQYVDSSTEFRSIHLKEMIQRRNLHIHNMGRVDEKYIERNDNGTPKYNIYNLAIGSVAKVDLPYWEMANRLCKDCVDYMTDWIERL